ncbi:hypothetical protein CMO96_02215 [Candidatus Woesebacteria bacterium]|nr:hypothetical protein [Candidatus Woesebacteria bacterium]
MLHAQVGRRRWRKQSRIGTIDETGTMRTIEISHKTIIFTLLLLGFLWLVAQIVPLILGLFVALLLMTALNPWVDTLSKLGVPRGLAILAVYILLISILAAGLTSIIPPLVEQTTNLVNSLPMLFEEVAVWLESVGLSGVDGTLIASQVSQLDTLPANLLKVIVSVFSNIVAVFMSLVVTFYLLLERKNLNKYLLVLFGEGGEKDAKRFVDRLEERLGGWVRGELALMFIVGVVTYIGLILLGIPYALPLAILAGLLEIIPGVGPFISAVPAVLLSLTISPAMALAVAALYFLVQQVENSVIVPKVMQTVVGVNPLVTIIVIIVGLKLAGVLGALLAVPIVIVIQVVAVEIFSIKALKKL